MSECDVTDDCVGGAIPPMVGSELTFDVVCQPCGAADIIQEAQGYCRNCAEHLCTACLTYHRRLTLTRRHTLVGKDEMPKEQTIHPTGDDCTEPCQTHDGEYIKYFCPDHKALLCSICIFPDHDLCKGKVYIPEKAKHLLNGTDFKEHESNIDALMEQSERIIKSSQNNVQLSADYCSKALQDIETFRQEMNVILDTFKVKLEKEAKRMATEEANRMSSINEECNAILEDLQGISSEFKTLDSKKQYGQMFIEMQKSLDKLTGFQAKLEEMGDACNYAKAFRFKSNEDLKTLYSRNDALGELQLKDPKERQTTHLTDIYVKSDANTKTCIVWGATVLSNTKIVIADYKNESIKLINTEHKYIMAEHKVETAPLHVTNISSNQVVATLEGAKKIVFLKAEDGLTFEKELTFDQQCYGLTYIVEDNTLAVSFSEPSEVRIVHMNGKVLQVFSNSSAEGRLINCAASLDMNPFNQSLYASDMGGNQVAMFDMEGQIRAVYTDDALNCPQKTAFDEIGNVYVCSTKSNTVHLLTPDCRKVKIILSECDGIKNPCAVCYCGKTGRLYVGMGDSDHIKVYQLK